MAFKEEISLVVTKEPILDPIMKSYVIKFTGSTLSQNNSIQKVEVWSSDKKELQKLVLQLGHGTTVKLFGHQRDECFRVSLNFGGKADVDVTQYEHDRIVELMIKKIHSEYISFIQDPLLHYLAEYPFKNGSMLNSLSRIGASCGVYGKHHSVNGGLLFHMDEMLRLLKADTSNHQINIEIAIVATIWHDLGKIAIVDEDNPSKIKIPKESPIDHERMGLVLLGKAVGESNLSIEMDNSTFRILCSTVGNVHNLGIYQGHLELIRNIDQISAKFSEDNSLMTMGFKEVIIQ
jgi:hypothetical protein